MGRVFPFFSLRRGKILCFRKTFFGRATISLQSYLEIYINLQRKRRRKSREKSKYSLLGSEGFGFQMVRIHPCPNNLHV